MHLSFQLKEPAGLQIPAVIYYYYYAESLLYLFKFNALNPVVLIAIIRILTTIIKSRETQTAGIEANAMILIRLYNKPLQSVVGAAMT